MKKQRVFIAMAITDYEGSSPVCAFLDKAEAKAFVEKCKEYRLDKPTSWENYKRWEKRHPAGEENAACDSFGVIEIPLVTT